MISSFNNLSIPDFIPKRMDPSFRLFQKRLAIC